ncbi:hypothetical protein EV421DRAFT_255830 [Armillaria borealis]|uniref:Uncharacterized protein n=1 Tax=Armillaria borealis TaxID=47425 RepID=A0AA39JPN7_9AGAR|nr:hypothetical protein EV421DRAFT_255830 [Armillaria borealis]
MFDNRLQFIYSLILPRPPFEIPPSHHDPIRCITNPRRHTLSTYPSKISRDSAQDYGADQTLTRPTSPHTPAKMVRQRRNSVADTPASIVSKKSRRATACCCSCHCPYTTPKHSVNSELNVIHAAPPSPLDPSFPPCTGDDIFGPTLETPLRSLRKRKSVCGRFHFYIAPLLDHWCRNFLLVPHPSTLSPEFTQKITFINIQGGILGTHLEV